MEEMSGILGGDRYLRDRRNFGQRKRSNERRLWKRLAMAVEREWIREGDD